MQSGKEKNGKSGGKKKIIKVELVTVKIGMRGWAKRRGEKV